MTKQVARPGDSLQKHYTASFTNQLKKKHKVYAVPRRQNTENPTKIKGRVATDSEVIFQRFEGVNLKGPFAETDLSITDGMHETVGVVVDDDLQAGRWGVSQGLIQEGYSDYVTVSGLTWALFDYTDGDTHVTVSSGILVSDVTGDAIIIFPPPAVDEPGLILLRGGGGGSTTNLIQGRLKDLVAGEEGTEFEGHMVGYIEVERTTCGARSFQYTGSGTSSDGWVRVVDFSDCIFDHPFEDLEDVWVWAVEDWQENINYDPDETIPNPDYVSECDPEHEDYDPDAVGCPVIVTPTIPNPTYDPREFICGWATLNRCCVSADNATGS